MSNTDPSMNNVGSKPRKVGRPRTKNIKVDDTPTDNTNKVLKKRGRKPRGGRVITITPNNKNPYVPQQNIILHLRCSSNDLSHNLNTLTNDFSNHESPDLSSKNDIFSNNSLNQSTNFIQSSSNNDILNNNNNIFDNHSDIDNDNSFIRDKINNLAINLHNNSISNNKSCCFWDTCSFDNPPLYIPKYVMNGVYHCYGCFCSPECAAAFLMNEQIDTSTRFERYHLLNHLYGKIYNYTKNIKPAPSPYHTLSKFYGSLSIQEFRQELKSERILIIVDKPLTRVLPELHEDNDLLNVNSKIISSNNFKLRRNSNKVSKTNALADAFNFK